jgi:uncharacterized membrane protein
MLSPIARLTNLTNGMHPAVKVGLLIAAAGLAWYALRAYRQSSASRLDAGPE